LALDILVAENRYLQLLTKPYEPYVQPSFIALGNYRLYLEKAHTV
jgi:hypothetical protein